MSVNKVILVGRVGKDPEIRNLQSGSSVATIVLATSETYTNRDKKKITNTEWHTIVAWSPLAGIIEKYVVKGDQLYIEGKIQTRSWDDKEGNKRYSTEVVARELRMLGGKKKEEKKEEKEQYRDPLDEAFSGEAEDLGSSDELEDPPY